MHKTEYKGHNYEEQKGEGLTIWHTKGSTTRRIKSIISSK